MVMDKYTKLHEFSQTAEELLEEGLEKRNNANKLIKSLKIKIEQAKNKGINTIKAEKILKKAQKIKEEAREIKDYDRVIKYVKLARDIILKLEDEFSKQKEEIIKKPSVDVLNKMHVSTRDVIIQKDTLLPSQSQDVATLSLSKRGAEYEVGLKIFEEKGKASRVFEFIKISPDSRKDLIKQINSVVTISNLLASSRGKQGEFPERLEQEVAKKELKNVGVEDKIKFGIQEQIENLTSFGKLLYGIFLPVQIQKHITTINQPIILETNDNEIPWELLHDDNDFLCLKLPVGRRLRSRDIPRTNPPIVNNKIKLLFIANASGDLHAAEEEVNFIRSNLSSDVEVEIFKGDDATNAVILSALRSGKYDIIHYAGHAEFNIKSPDESALLVAEKGKIYAQEIKRILGGKPFVFLNACSSGKEKICEAGESYTGSDTEGLASSFILGGALAIIGASWPTPDLSAGFLAAEFYKYFLSGDTVGEALLKARREFKSTRTNDINWAAFTLYGDPTLRLTKKLIHN